MNMTQNGLILPSKEMTKRDLIETILMIINKILDFTDTLEQRTPSIFDKNYTHEELDSDKLSTGSSSNEDNITSKISQKDEEYTLTDYFYFWIKKLDFNENLLFLTMMNIDKLLDKEFILTDVNVKNVLFICMIITQKNYEDENFNDKDYAKILDVSTEELINMELNFLEFIDFSLYISQEEFNKYVLKMEQIWKSTFSMFTFS